MYKIIIKFSCYDFVERDLQWLAGLEPGQHGYGNEGDSPPGRC
jgi:hypothetical protein